MLRLRYDRTIKIDQQYRLMSAHHIAPTDQNRPVILGGAPISGLDAPDWPVRDEAVAAVLRRMIETGDWGRYQAGFCDTLLDRLRTAHSVAHAHLTSSGTAAVELALRGVKVGTGDEVIMAGYDFKANFTNILLLGALPVLVDVMPQSGQLCVDRLPGAMTSKTKAILVSHLHGAAVDMPQLMEIARERQIPVIEDASQMGLARVAGRPAGTWGDVGVLSFGGSKLLTAGRGGAVLTHHAEIHQRIHLHTQRGNDAYPLSEMQAAVLLPQLESLSSRRQQREQFASTVRASLIQVAGLVPFFSDVPDCDLDYYKLGFWYDPDSFTGLSRAEFCCAMQREGIALYPGFRALHLTHARRRFRAAGELSYVERLDRECVTLHHPILLLGADGAIGFLKSLNRVREHAGAIKAFFASHPEMAAQ